MQQKRMQRPRQQRKRKLWTMGWQLLVSEQRAERWMLRLSMQQQTAALLWLTRMRALLVSLGQIQAQRTQQHDAL